MGRIEKRAIVDASSAILLMKAGLFRLATDCYAMFLAGAVYREISRSGYPGADEFETLWKNRRCHIVPDESTTRPFSDDGLISMGEGEKKTIQAYLEHGGDFIIIDDKKGAGFCRRNGIPYVNALLMPRIFRLSGLLSEEACTLKTEEIIGFGRYAGWVIQEAGSISDRHLIRFVP